MSEASVEKLRQTNIKKYGSEEAWAAEMSKRGSIGGKISKRKLTSEQAREMGRMGNTKRYGTKVNKDVEK